MQPSPLVPGRLALAALILAALACARAAPTVTSVAATLPAEAASRPAATATAAPTATFVPASPTPGPTAPTAAPPAATTQVPATPAVDLAALAGTIASDVTYCTSAEGLELKMDVYYPASLAAPAPAVVFIHGGGWSGGDKRQGAPLFASLVNFDFIVVSLNYRHAPQFPFPAQIQDVKCAIRSLRANAGAHGLDPARIGAMGTSAGAHLAALLGLTGETPGWDTGQYLEQSSQVAAVVDFFGPMDLTLEFPGLVSAIGEDVFGATSPDDRVLVEASPVTYITPAAPPFLIIHGTLDEFVPVSQSERLYESLTAAGVPAELILVENGRHAFIADVYPVTPSREALLLKVIEFFDEHLK